MFTIEARAESPASRPVRPLERYGIPFVSLALLVGEGQVIQPQFSVEERILSTMLNRVDWGGADFLLIDMPPGTGKSLNGILDTGLVDAVIVVATREGLAHMDNARLLHLLDRYPRVPVLGIVENMTHLICPNCGEAIDLYPLPVAEVRQSYREVPVIASLPFDPALIRQPAGGAPVPLREPDSPVGAALLALADQVVAQVTDGEDGEA
jgi:ATP-binding protein involved in chromosome partitioning